MSAMCPQRTMPGEAHGKQLGDDEGGGRWNAASPKRGAKGGLDI